MDNTPPPVEPIPQQQVSSNISWLKTLSYGFTLVSFGIAIGIIGYFLTMKKSKQVSQKQQFSISPTISPTIDPTTNWKTYSSSRFGYSIKYPLNTEFIPGIQFEFQLKNKDFLMTFLPLDLNPTETVTSYIQTSFCGTGGGKIVEMENINGNKIYTNLESSLNKNATCLESVIQLASPFKIIDIQGLGYSQNGISQFNQILSTFKFTDQNPTPTCRARPACLDTSPQCLITETPDMCPPIVKK